jgi:integrase
MPPLRNPILNANPSPMLVRGVPLHRDLIIELANLPHRDGCVFRKPNGEPYERPCGDYEQSAGGRIKTGFKAALRRAGIENFRVHDCRHTWATWHYAEHHDLQALQKLGGWNSLSMVVRYAMRTWNRIALASMLCRHLPQNP